MAVLRSLVVSVKAKVKKFVEGMGKAKTSAGGFGAKIAKLGPTMLKFGTVLGGVAAGALTLIIKKYSAIIDKVGKLSDRIKISVVNLRGLQRGGELSGSSAESMAKALEQMTRRLGEAKGGTGEALDALKLLGLRAEELVKLDAGDAFLEIADRISMLATQADKAEASYGLFGRKGIELVNILQQGKGAIKDVIAETTKLRSGGLSRADVKGVEDMNDAVTDLKTSMAGLAEKLTAELAPSLQKVAEALTDIVIFGGQAAGKLRKVAAVTALVTGQTGFALKFAQAEAQARIDAILEKRQRTLKATVAATDRILAGAEARKPVIGGRVSGAVEKLAGELAAKAAATEKTRLAAIAAEVAKIKGQELAIAKIREQRAEALFLETRTAKEMFKLQKNQLDNDLRRGTINKEIFDRKTASLKEELGLTKKIEAAPRQLAREINLARVAIPGMGGAQKIERQQLTEQKKTNTILTDIRLGLGGRLAAVTS